MKWFPAITVRGRSFTSARLIKRQASPTRDSRRITNNAKREIHHTHTHIICIHLCVKIVRIRCRMRNCPQNCVTTDNLRNGSSAVGNVRRACADSKQYFKQEVVFVIRPKHILQIPTCFVQSRRKSVTQLLAHATRIQFWKFHVVKNEKYNIKPTNGTRKCVFCLVACLQYIQCCYRAR